MSEQLKFKDAFTSWDEALPMGNGHFGAMAYFDEDEGFNLVFNHYDVWYRKLQFYTRGRPQDISLFYSPDKTPSLDEVKRRAIEAHEDKDHFAHKSYTKVMSPEIKDQYGHNRPGFSQVISGFLKLHLVDELANPENIETKLDLETGQVFFEISSSVPKLQLGVTCSVLKGIDIGITKIRQNASNVKAIELGTDLGRLVEVYPATGSKDSQYFYLENGFYSEYEDKDKYPPFKYVFMIKLAGARASISQQNPDRLVIKPAQDTHDFTILTTVVTEIEGPELVLSAMAKIDEAIANLDSLETRTQQFWKEFGSKSSITIPDKILETLWHLHLYSLACCSGDGARLFQHACGLTGLWNIKSPTQWGSMFYWDSNIQQAYWPIFTANHLELCKSFEDALLSYVPAARMRAEKYFGLKGIAGDFPFDCFFCIWPWMMQYFWWHYRYSGDKKFLREKAYPLMKEIAEFYDQFLQRDEKTGLIYVFPEVSPEQGPMTRNSTVFLATFKYMLKGLIRAGEILKCDQESAKKWCEMLNLLPDYPKGVSEKYGEIIKDSEWAPTDLNLAHSGLLMPIYPVGEINKHSAENLKALALRTLNYAQERQAIGTHNFVWLACTAARMGWGQLALDILYKKGIAFLMRANGFFAEETERWRQNCALSLDNAFHPALMESGSALVAAVNEMLLQSHSDYIEVFPSLPNDTDGSQWQDCRFENLLAEGGFEVSAARSGGQLQSIKIHSLAGNRARVLNSFNGPFTMKASYVSNGNMIEFDTEKNGKYELKRASRETAPISNAPTSIVFPVIYQAPTKRRVFLGKNELTDYYRAIDGMTQLYYAGDMPVPSVSLYKFDFTDPDLAKKYETALPKQYYDGAGKPGTDFKKITAQTTYSGFLGYGWSDPSHLIYCDRGEPDCLVRDFVSSSQPAEFSVTLVKSTYRILLISGDIQEDVNTFIKLSDGTVHDPGIIRKGRIKPIELAYRQFKDGVLKISLSSACGLKWNIAAIFINRVC